MDVPLDYANLTGRPPGRVLRAASLLSRGVASVQRQMPRYAQQWHDANQVALARPGRRWYVLGDSMSQGIGATAFDRGWVDQLAARLEGDGTPVVVVNLSASGARVPDVLDTQLPVLTALGVRPDDLVTVLIGSNDLMSGAHRATLPAAFERLVATLPNGSVVATMPQPRAAARASNAVLAAAAARGAISLVEMRSSGLSSWRGRLAADHFHPNELGYAGIADAFHGPVARRLHADGNAEVAR
jgi:lysophospholipase L1-like esterase